MSFYNGGVAPTDLVADLLGWFPDVSEYNSLTPARLMDTRAGHATIDSGYAGQGSLGGGGSLGLQVTGRAGIPATGVGAVVLNVTAVSPQGVGYLTLWPSGAQRPHAANLNLNPGLTIPNLVITKVGADGKVSLYSGGVAPTDVVVDVQGWFSDSP